MKSYYRLMLGKASRFALPCFEGSFIGVHLSIDEDLTGKLPDDWRAFNKQFIPSWLSRHPDKTKIGAGLACGALWTVAKGIRLGDVVLCPDGQGSYRVGEVTGEYRHASGHDLPHQRPVRWLPLSVERALMREALQDSTGGIGTISDVTKHSVAIEKLISGDATPSIVATDPTIEDPSAFAMEKHLEDFLVQNWAQTDLGRTFDIYEEDGEKVGKQYPTDTGPMDILAIRKDKKELLVVELKKGRASDAVVGQLLRYMGFALQDLAENGQTVRGIIIALEDDPRIRRALAATQNVEFYRYQISFKLLKA